MTDTAPLAASESSNDFDQLLQQAVQASHDGRWDDANQSLQLAMQQRPASPIPYLLLGANYAETGSNDQAEAAYIASVTRAPDWGIVRFQLGLLQLTNARPGAAQATWEPLLTLPDDHHLKLFVQGFAAILNADREAAERFIHLGIARNAENPPLNQDMYGVLARLEALTTAEPALQSPLPVDTPAEEAQGTSHFLISSYNN